jgi:hypothetical protein
MGFIIFLLLIPLIDLLMNWNGNTMISKEYVLHPSMASFLSGHSMGHITQMLYIWMLPLYLLITYCDYYIQEKKVGYNIMLLSRISKRDLIKSKMIISFFVPFLISFISVSLNFVLANIIFKGGVYFSGLERFVARGINILHISIQHPIITYIIYILVFSLITGGCGIICTGICLLFPKYKVTYPIVFFIWIIQIAMPYSLTYAMQPFIEYGLDYIIPALLIFLIIVLIVSVSGFIFKVKNDEF